MAEACTCPWNNGYHLRVLGHHVSCPALTRRHYSGDGCPTVGRVHAGHRDPDQPPTGWLDPAAAQQLRAQRDALLPVAQAAKAYRDTIDTMTGRHGLKAESLALLAAVDEWQHVEQETGHDG